MIIQQIPVGPFQMNAYVLHQEKNYECLLIDPGDEVQKIYSYIDSNNLKPVAIFNTHAHIDHVRFAGDVQEHYRLPFYLSKNELPLLDMLSDQGRMFGISTSPPPTVDHVLKEGQHYDLADLSFNVVHTPGHSPGSMCLLFDGHAIVGDVLFNGSIGRTDLYMGDFDMLINSIKTKLLVLNDETIIYPGHGPVSSIGRERQYNPFLQD